ncbi:MAG: hypothetical protein ACE5Q9_07340 [Nitrosopumilus sp.]
MVNTFAPILLNHILQMLNVPNLLCTNSISSQMDSNHTL